MKDHSQILLEKIQSLRLISQSQLENLVEDSKKLNKTPQQLVIERKIIPHQDFLKIYSQVIGFPYIKLDKLEIKENILRMLPEEAIRKYKFIPFELEENLLKVGMVDPEDEGALEALRFIVQQKQGLSLQIFLIDEESFKKVLRDYENLAKKVEEALTELETKMPEFKRRGGVIFAEPIVAEAPISKIVAVIIRYAIESRASDIHIEPLDNAIKVRFRIDGDLHASLFLKKEFHQQIVTRIKILSRLRIDETRVPQDGRFHVRIENRKIDFRVSTLPTANGEKAVLRILDPTISVENLEGLGLEGRNLKVVSKALTIPYGMVLSSGPTGSGKTTTLYTILKLLNTEDVNIVSLEDPIEYFIEGINQSQILPEIGYTFATGLRHILRQDPDIILVGEIRDAETANLAVHAALTGHVLLSSIHTNDVLGIIPRLIDMGIEKYLIPSTVSIGIAQRLARRLCQSCKESYKPSPEIIKTIKEAYQGIPQEEKIEVDFESLELHKPRGCKECGNKGTKGRIGLFETIEMTPELEEIIVTAPLESKIKQEAKRQKMITMFQDGVLKVIKGIIDFNELLRAVKVSY